MGDIRSRIFIAISFFAIALAACTFEPAKGAPYNLVLGAPCTDDRDCASHVCSSAGAIGECLECRASTSCPSGRSCDLASGRCLPDPVPQLVHTPRIGGDRRMNDEGRVHVGRVSVVPVTTVVESKR